MQFRSPNKIIQDCASGEWVAGIDQWQVRTGYLATGEFNSEVKVGVSDAQIQEEFLGAHIRP